MNFNFELILFYAVILTGVIALADILFFAKKRKKKMPLIFEYSRSFFPVLLLVFLLRAFLYEPYRIPTGSLKPTLPIGDFVLVNKFTYGIRLPVIYKKIVKIHEPLRGDIIVFRWPPDPSIDYIKRVIGVPGDHIDYVGKILYVNGHEIPQKFEKNVMEQDENGDRLHILQKQENLLGVQHAIYQTNSKINDDFKDVVVPAGMYFVMGDNRDDSADSRYFGFVPEQNIIGKAVVVWMSWNSDANILHKIRWSRLGKRIQ